MSYLVMECHMGYAVVLDEYGRFLKVVNRHYEVGQTVYDVIPVREKPQTAVYIRVARIAVAVAACLLLIVGGAWWNWWMPYGSVYMTINPEVQIDLNRYGDVLNVTGVNEDGKTLLSGYTYQGKEKEQVLKELVDRAIELQMLSAGGEVKIDVSSSNETFVKDTETTLTDTMRSYLDETIGFTVLIDGNSLAPQQESSIETPESSLDTSSETVSAPESSDHDDDDDDDDDHDDDDHDDDDDDDDDDDHDDDDQKH